MKAINAWVYKNESFKGCAMDGVSEKFNELLFLHESGNLDVNGDEENLCKAVRREIGGRDVYHIVPEASTRGWYSMGGAFAYSCDARFSELVGGQYGAIAIHDRVEW